MDETIGQVVDVAKNPVFEVDSGETDGVPDLRAEEVGLTLDEGVQQKDIGSGKVNSFLFMDADYFPHCHDDIDLQALDLFLLEKTCHGDSGLGWKGHDGNGIEGDGQRIKSIGEGIVK